MIEASKKVKFAAFAKKYTVQAASERYAICTCSGQYTIIDSQEKIKGTCDHWSHGAQNKEQCEKMLASLISGEAGISMRNRAALDIETITD